jgi:hypothetical protein
VSPSGPERASTATPSLVLPRLAWPSVAMPRPKTLPNADHVDFHNQRPSDARGMWLSGCRAIATRRQLSPSLTDPAYDPDTRTMVRHPPQAAPRRALDALAPWCNPTASARLLACRPPRRAARRPRGGSAAAPQLRHSRPQINGGYLHRESGFTETVTSGFAGESGLSYSSSDGFESR